MGSSRDQRLVLTGQGDLISGIMGGNGGYVRHQLPVLPPQPYLPCFWIEERVSPVRKLRFTGTGTKRQFISVEGCYK